MAAIIKGHVIADGPQLDAVLKTLREHGVQVTKTPSADGHDLYDLYLSSEQVNAESGLRSLATVLDREQPDWRDVFTLSG